MMIRCGLLVLLITPALWTACDKMGGGSNQQVERLPEVRPNLPEVPTLPPAPYPIQYPDGSYSVYGLRKRMRNTMDTDVTVTGYIAEIYQAPECPKKETCPRPSAPHMWVADSPNEKDPDKRLNVVGYAQNQEEIDKAVAQARHGSYKAPPSETGLLPIPTDFAQGAKIKVQGKFTRISGSGFNESTGLLEYKTHSILK